MTTINQDSDYGEGLSIDTDSDFVYVTGNFTGSAKFGSNTFTSNAFQDAFIVK